MSPTKFNLSLFGRRETPHFNGWLLDLDRAKRNAEIKKARISNLPNVAIPWSERHGQTSSSRVIRYSYAAIALGGLCHELTIPECCTAAPRYCT